MIERMREINRLNRKVLRIQRFIGKRNQASGIRVARYESETTGVGKLREIFRIEYNNQRIQVLSGRIADIHAQQETIASETLAGINVEEFITNIQPGRLTPFSSQEQTPAVSAPELPTQEPEREELDALRQPELPISQLEETQVVEKPKRQTEAKPAKTEQINLHFQNGKEVTVRKSHHALMLRKLIQRRKTSSELTKELLGIDTPENRSNFTRHIVSKAKKLASQNGYEVLNKEGQYRLKMLRTTIQKERASKKTRVSEQEQKIPKEKTPRKASGKIKIVQVPASLIDGVGEQEEKQESKTEAGEIASKEVGKLGRESKKNFNILRQEIEVTGARNIELVEHILEGFNLTTDLSELIYGENTPETRNRIAPIAFGLNKKLNSFGITIKNTNESNRRLPASYEFKHITEELAKVALQTTTETPALVTEVPYTPTEEEIRTEEETRVVENVVALLSKSEKINFGLLQRGLRIESRVRTLQGGLKQYRPYQVDELKKLFTTGIRKLREESISNALKEKWSEDDIMTWALVKSQAERFRDSDFNEYVRLVNRKLDTAKKEFEALLREPIPAWLNFAK